MASLSAAFASLKRRLKGGDNAKAWDLKREFFWTAFKALDFNGISGDYAEFGSHGGMTFRLAYDQISRRRTQRQLWAFDSFQGLPPGEGALDSHPKWQQGSMKTGEEAFRKLCRGHGMAEGAYTLVPGFYEETLTGLADDAAPADIALAYIDCDLYSSTMTVLDFLKPRLKHGMIVALDDYYCWAADAISGERRALLEFMAANPQWHFSLYREIGWAGAAFLVERADLLAT